MCRFFPPSLHDETGRPIRFELRSRAAAVAQKGESGGAAALLLKNQCKQTLKKCILREKWTPSYCYHWYLTTDLFSHVLYTEYNFY